MKANVTKQKNNARASAGTTGADESTVDRTEFIATAAYYKAEARGFAPGQDLDNWLEAEVEFERRQMH